MFGVVYGLDSTVVGVPGLVSMKLMRDSTPCEPSCPFALNFYWR
jgi:hypothetical protein